MAVFRHQPLKGLYLTCQLIATLLIRFPLWILLGLPRSNRPRKTWSLRRTIWVKLIRTVFSISNTIGPFRQTPDHRAITPGVGVNGVWVGAAAKHLVTGKLKLWADIANVASVRLPGYWFHKKGSPIKVASAPLPGEKVIYQLHGGAYVRLSAHPSDPTAQITKGYLSHIDAVQRVFGIEYRLASTKPNAVQYPFPTQLLDALAGYNYLIAVVGFAPEDIIISGDSAGANLAHALVRYLTEYQDTADMPAPPGALILLSPWVDLGTTTEKLPNGSMANFQVSDYITNDAGVAYAKTAFCGPHGRGIAETNSYISPASLHSALEVDFKKFPRTFIVAGGAEALYDSIVILKDRMVRDLGEGDGAKPDEGKVRYYEAPDGIHDYIVFLWHEPERTETLKALDKWISMESSLDRHQL